MNAQERLSQVLSSYSALDANDLLRVTIAQEFKGRIALISSFGADAALMLSLVADVDKATPVLFLETQKHFPETLDYARTLTAQLGLANVHWLTPDPAMVARIDPKEDLWSFTPDRCCWMRKVEPLERAVKELGIEALITGRKKYQTSDRQQMQAAELDEKGIFRINPIRDWSKERQKQEIVARGLPAHPLVEKGYPSIGCAPCTIPVAPGQDERAGRWAHTAKLGEQKTECGLHVPQGEQ